LSQTDERCDSSENRWREYVHKKKPCTCTQRSSYMLSFVCVCHLPILRRRVFYLAGILALTAVTFRGFITLDLLIMVKRKEDRQR